MDGMQRIHKNLGASERQPGRDATLANPDTMSASDVPARPDWVSHADKSMKAASSMSGLYRHSSPHRRGLNRGAAITHREWKRLGRCVSLRTTYPTR